MFSEIKDFTDLTTVSSGKTIVFYEASACFFILYYETVPYFMPDEFGLELVDN